MNNIFFRIAMENLTKHRDIKLVATKASRTYLVSEPNYHISMFFFRKFVSYRKEKIFLNKSM